MKDRDFKFHNGDKGAALAIRVKAGARQERIKRVLRDGTVVIQLKAAGKDLNDDLIRFISHELRVDKSSLEIIAGQDGKNKLVSIMDMQPEDIQRAVLDLID